MLSNGKEISGQLLERRLEQLMMFRKLMQVVERRGPVRKVVLALLEGDARDKTFWTDRAAVTALADYLRGPNVLTTVTDETEHQALAVSDDPAEQCEEEDRE